MTFTRIRAPYVNSDGFRFSISRKDFLTDFAKEHFGTQDVIIGFREFDDQFVVQGNKERRLRELFSHDLLRELTSTQMSFSLSVRDDEGWFSTKFPEGVDELYYVIGGTVQDLKQLRTLFEVFAETLNRLYLIGSAEGEEPGVVL